MLRTATSLAIVLLPAFLAAPTPLLAQPGRGPSPVGVTQARAGSVAPTLELPGEVESRRSALVASEVAGLVTDLLAREGDRVRGGQSLVRLRQEGLSLRLDAAEGDLEEAEARLELATSSLERARSLFAEQVISRQQLDDAISEHAAWQARVSQLEADRRRIEDDLERSTVRAPFGGVVVAEHTQVGEWITAGGPVVELVDTSALEVTVQVPERTFPSLEPGDRASVRFDALPGVTVAGEVRAVVPRADPRSRTFPVKVAFSDPQGRIGVGMLARVRLATGTGGNAVLVPKDAVVTRGEESRLWALVGGNKVEPRPVTLGQAAGAWIEVFGELAPGDRVVTRGNERLQPGQEVQPSPVEYDAP